MEWMGLPGSFIPEVALSGPSKQHQQWSQPDWSEYLLVIQPAAEVYDKIKEEKQSFFERYSERGAIKAKPYITVANFFAKESMEETLIRWIQRICSLQKSFDVTLNNYSGFPPHTIYLRVMDHEPFRILAKELKVIDEFVRSSGCPKVHLVNKPHLSIARRLKEEIYEKAMRVYSQKSFCESFTAGQLILLRREVQSDGCKTINIFNLKPKESSLFN